ncbi:MAG: peptidyl-alpha-hydroxyglycine alpha-amidating lyase family protein [Acidobacteriota bacterium]
MRALVFLIGVVCCYGQVNDPVTNNNLPNPYRTLRDWAELPKGMTWPAITGVMEGPDGNLYVLGRCNENSCAGRKEPAVLVYNSSGKLLNTWGSGLFSFPHGFLVDKDGNVWISDAQAGIDGKVFKFTRDGKLLLTLSENFDQPTSIAIAPNGDIFVSEGHAPAYGNSRIVKFTKDGKRIKVIGQKGRGPGEFMGPHNLAFDSRGRLFVADRGNNRIQILDQEGRFLAEWRQFGRPSGLFITKDDTLYVADSESWGPDEPGWKKGIRIGSAKDGKVFAFIEDMESTTEEHSGAEAVGVDSKGNVYGGVVRRKMLEKHVK